MSKRSPSGRRLTFDEQWNQQEKWEAAAGGAEVWAELTAAERYVIQQEISGDESADYD